MSEIEANAAEKSAEGSSEEVSEADNKGQDGDMDGGVKHVQDRGVDRAGYQTDASEKLLDSAAISSATRNADDDAPQAGTETQGAGDDDHAKTAKALNYAGGNEGEDDSTDEMTLIDLSRSTKKKSDNNGEKNNASSVNNKPTSTLDTPAQAGASNNSPTVVTQSSSKHRHQSKDAESDGRKDPPEEMKKLKMEEFSECVVYDVHPSQLPIYNGTVAQVDQPYHFTQISARVNHGVRKEQTMADIMNNWLGNPADIPKRPDPSMNNDPVNLRLTTLVERLDKDNLDEGCAVQVMATIPNDTSRAWEDWKAEYFLPKTNDNKNRLIDFLDNHKERAAVDAFNVENHESILQMYPGSKRLYDKLIDDQNKGGKKKGKSKKKKSVDNITRYHALIWAISAAKQQTPLEHECIMNAVEGNNRMGALNHLLLLSEYNTRDGELKCNTLKKKWLVDNLGAPAERDGFKIDQAYKDLDIRELLQRKLEDPASMFNKSLVRVKIWVGETREEFEKHRVPMTTITNLDIEKSRIIATDKQRSSEPGENVTLATNIKSLLLMMVDNEDTLQKGETVSFSPNASTGGRLYVDYRRCVESDDDKQPIAPPPCRLFTTREWTALSKDPNDPENLRAFMNSIDIGSVVMTDPLPADPQPIETPSPASGSTGKRRRSPTGGRRKNAKQVLGPSGKSYHPPFALNFDNMIKNEGARKVGTDEAKKKLKAATIAERWIDLGQRVVPLSQEEFTRAVLLCLIVPAMYRAFFIIKRADWENHPKREECEHALEYLVRTQNFTMGADDFAKVLPSGVWENEPWAEKFGLDEKHTALTPEYRYLAAACCLSDLIISCLSVGGKKGLKRAFEFVRMLSQAHDDMTGYNDRAMVEILGVLYIKMQDFTKILHARIRHDGNMRHKGGDRSASGFVFWCLFMGQMESVNRVMRIYGLDPKPQIGPRELSFARQFKNLLDQMKKRENGRNQPSQVEKNTYRIIQDNVAIEIKVPEKNGIIQKPRKIVNARFSKSRDADANLAINSHSGMASLTSLTLMYLCYSAKTCQDELEVDNENPRIIMSPYHGNKGGTAKPRYKEIVLEKTEWTLGDMVQPRSQEEDGHLKHFFEMSKFVFGANVRKSMTSGRQASVKSANACRNTTVNNDTWTLDVVERYEEETSDSEEEDAKPKAVPPKQQRLNRGITNLRALRMAILESKKKQTTEEKAAALDEIQLLWDLHLDQLSGELRENISTVKKLTPKEKKEMDDPAMDRHYASIERGAARVLWSLREGAIDEKPEENENAAATQVHLETMDEEVVKERKGDAGEDMTIDNVREFCTTVLKRGMIYKPIVGGDLRAKNGTIASALESWFAIGDPNSKADYSGFSQEDMATMTKIREGWILKKDPEENNVYKLKKRRGGNSSEGSSNDDSSDEEEEEEEEEEETTESDEDDSEKKESEKDDSGNERENKRRKIDAKNQVMLTPTKKKVNKPVKPAKSPIAAKGWTTQRKENAIEAVPKQGLENRDKQDYCIETNGIKVNLLSKEDVNTAYHAWRKLMNDEGDNDDNNPFEEQLYYVLCYSLQQETWRDWWRDHYEGDPKKLNKTDGIKDLVSCVMKLGSP